MGTDSEGLPNGPRGASAGVGKLVNPLDFIAEDHMREREVCAVIDRIVASAPVEGAELEQVLAFLEIQLPQHLADEENQLFPLMLERSEPAYESVKVIDNLQDEHGHAHADRPPNVAKN